MVFKIYVIGYGRVNQYLLILIMASNDSFLLFNFELLSLLKCLCQRPHVSQNIIHGHTHTTYIEPIACLAGISNSQIILMVVVMAEFSWKCRILAKQFVFVWMLFLRE